MCHSCFSQSRANILQDYWPWDKTYRSNSSREWALMICFESLYLSLSVNSIAHRNSNSPQSIDLKFYFDQSIDPVQAISLLKLKADTQTKKKTPRKVLLFTLDSRLLSLSSLLQSYTKRARATLSETKVFSLDTGIIPQKKVSMYSFYAWYHRSAAMCLYVIDLELLR